MVNRKATRQALAGCDTDTHLYGHIFSNHEADKGNIVQLLVPLEERMVATSFSW